MIAKAKSIAHGAVMTNYVTKQDRADIVLTRNLDEGLTPLAMWGAMEVIHQKYAPNFKRKPVTKPTLRMEVSPSIGETKEWTLQDWHDYTVRFLEELEKAVQSKGKNKGGARLDLSRAQLFAALHHDSMSGIPHLHIIINRIDLDGNILNDSFIGKRATMAAHAINVERGWELPEDIHEAHLREITNACYDTLRGMPRYDWLTYVQGLERRGYRVKVLSDNNGVIHGYTVLFGNSRFKSSKLGRGRDLMPSKLETTWHNLHHATNAVAMPKPTATEHLASESLRPQPVAQPTQVAASNYSDVLSVGGKEYPVKMSMSAYKAMEETVATPDMSVAHEDVMKVAMLLFMSYLDGATTMSESCGGGGSPGSGWGRRKEEDEYEWARRCALKANWLCKPLRRNRNFKR